jgi:RNA polymerase sigma-70 factor (ECF subfamily)
MSRAEDVPGPLTLAEASPTFRRDPGTSDQLDVLCVRRCLDGRAEAFEEIVARYQKPMFNLIYQMVHDYEDAREITQTAFLKAFSSLKRFDQERRFFSWLCRIAMNESINALASRKPSEPILSDFASAAASPEDRASAAEVRACLRRALQTLSPEYRAVITLRHIANCSYREASEILGIPEKTVKSRLFSARQLLREELRARGFGGGA